MFNIGEKVKFYQIGIGEIVDRRPSVLYPQDMVYTIGKIIVHPWEPDPSWRGTHTQCQVFERHIELISSGSAVITLFEEQGC